jgi:hypothetical protein
MEIKKHNYTILEDNNKPRKNEHGNYEKVVLAKNEHGGKEEIIIDGDKDFLKQHSVGFTFELSYLVKK